MDHNSRCVVVLLGSAGSGKTTLAQKVAGKSVHFRSTRESAASDSPCGCLRIIDTPGLLEGQEERALEISRAVNSDPITKLLIVVKAEVRMDVTLETVQGHAERFLDLGDTLLALCVTHMDTVAWTKEDFTRRAASLLDFGPVIFLSKDSERPEILRDILRLCQGQETAAVHITEKNFLRCFNVAGSHLGARRAVQDEVARFKRLMESFSKELCKLSGARQGAAVADFRDWVMGRVINEAVSRVAAQSAGSRDIGEGMQVDLGNQLRDLLHHPHYVREELRTYLRGGGDRSFHFTFDGQELLLWDDKPLPAASGKQSPPSTGLPEAKEVLAGKAPATPITTDHKSPSVVVLLGSAGSGKTTLAQKVGLNTSTRVFDSPCGRLRIIDPLGPMDHVIKRAMMNSKAECPKLLLTVKALARMDVTLEPAQVLEGLPELQKRLLGLCVTHMDTVSWNKDTFLRRAAYILDSIPVIFVSRDTARKDIMGEILKLCDSRQATATGTSKDVPSTRQQPTLRDQEPRQAAPMVPPAAVADPPGSKRVWRPSNIPDLGLPPKTTAPGHLSFTPQHHGHERVLSRGVTTTAVSLYSPGAERSVATTGYSGVSRRAASPDPALLKSSGNYPNEAARSFFNPRALSVPPRHGYLDKIPFPTRAQLRPDGHAYARAREQGSFASFSSQYPSYVVSYV